MGGTRATHINRLRTHAGKIFGPGFEQTWFATKFKRGSVEMLQVVSGAYVTTKGKKYRLLPPILFPKDSEHKKDVFLNPALIKVSLLFYQLTNTRYTDNAQVLQVILFGPSSLQGGYTGKASGPKPAGAKWGLRKITPGAIAFAAILVNLPLAVRLSFTLIIFHP